MVLFTISLLVNIRQCSDSQTHEEDVEAIEYEVLELESEIIKINKENKKLKEVKKPASKIKGVKKFKPRVKVPEPVDSIDSIPEIKIIDSLIIN